MVCIAQQKLSPIRNLTKFPDDQLARSRKDDILRLKFFAMASPIVVGVIAYLNVRICNEVFEKKESFCHFFKRIGCVR